MRALLLALAVAQAAPELASVADLFAQMYRRAADLPASAAVAELRSALDIPVPPGPDGDQLRGDIHAELSRRLLQTGDAAAALQAARDGIAAIAPDPSPVAALLLLREAEALEALGRDADAVDTYERTIAVARSLLQEKP